MSSKNQISDNGKEILLIGNLDMNDNENEPTSDAVFLSNELDTTQTLIKFDPQTKRFCSSTCELYDFF